MPRPKKSIDGVRSGLTGEKNVKIKTPTPQKAVRVKKVVRKAPSALKQSVNVGVEDTSEENECSLFFHLNTSSGIAELSYEIPVQTATIKMLRVHFKTLQANQTYPAIGIVMGSVFSPIQVNSNLSMTPIPIMTDYSKVDTITYPNISLTMGKALPRRISYRIIDLTTNELIPDTALDFVQIWLQYSTGVIN